MLKTILHRIVAHPWVYDQVQILAGAPYLDRNLAVQLAALAPISSVLDVGGGTGRLRALWSPTSTYVCLDMDELKLRRFVHRQSDGFALLADAAQLPIASCSVDVVLCVDVFHHIPDNTLPAMLRESRRVLKPSGALVLIDPVWNPRRLVGRVLWKYDRGAYPRTPEVLHSALTTQFERLHRGRLAFWHEYLLWVGRPRAA